MNHSNLRAHAEDPTRQVADLASLCVQAHAANLMTLHDGSLACVWFGGSMEGKSDISVFMSTLKSDTWSPPVQLSNDPDRSEQNPMLFPTPDGKLWLLHTAQLSGNQDTAIVRRRISTDHGQTWGPSEQIEGLAQGTFVRQPIHVHTDGAWLMPAWYCRVNPGEKWDGSLDVSVVYRSTDQGKSWISHLVPDSLGCVHMSIVPSSDGKLLAFFRSRWADFVYTSSSTDGGVTWASPTPTTLLNNNSSVQALSLIDGRLALVFNNSSHLDATERRASLYDELDDEHGAATSTTTTTPSAEIRRAFWGAPRAPMTVAISEDNGKTWPWKRNLEVGDGYCMSNDSARHINREYSYPSLRQTSDGALHIAYTVFRQHIRHTKVSLDWITAPVEK